jgi:hypothetical protein
MLSVNFANQNIVPFLLRTKSFWRKSYKQMDWYVHICHHLKINGWINIMLAPVRVYRLIYFF